MIEIKGYIFKIIVFFQIKQALLACAPLTQPYSWYILLHFSS